MSTSPATSWSPSSLRFPLLRRRPTSCCSLFEKNIFATVYINKLFACLIKIPSLQCISSRTLFRPTNRR